MGKLRTTIKSHNERRKFFLREEREEIIQSNMSTLRYASLFTVLLLVALLVLAALLIKDWVPSPYHYALLPVSIVLCAIAWSRGTTDQQRLLSVLLLMFNN